MNSKYLKAETLTGELKRFIDHISSNHCADNKHSIRTYKNKITKTLLIFKNKTS